MPNFVLKSPRYVCTRDCKEYQHLPFVAGGYHDTSRTQSGSGGGVQGRGSTGGRILGRGSGSSGLPKPYRGTSKLPTALQSEATKSNSTTTLVNTTPGSASRIGVKQPSAINPPTAGNSNHNANLNSSQDTPPSGIAVDGNGAVNPNSESYNSIQLFENSTSNAPDLQSNLKLESGKKSKTLQNHKVLSIAKDSNETSAERSIPGDGNESFTSTPASRIRSDTSNNNSGYSLL
ncbi:hypothetical protein AX774_g3049 [Zancudomyces culisetae]|uniref:Uncharacterized protein n=1 Tax=Zancudomyces culisetae TaxID=1213189 RepID=A0A1R1PRC6_ZANCU|nr:hypothetical protein AX774_g3049 [Zancudomyces culisetae]|eukprot:OMH83463.1 hypothetical protein AX774_g3049 [Zancudomyces culisetae]